MAFNSPSGPPASNKQLEFLASLLEEHDLGTFREARHRLGLTQRQANGKFTVGEASELIDRLTAGEFEPGPGGVSVAQASAGEAGAAVAAAIAADRAEAKLARQREEAVAGMPADLLADELTRRGWCCIPPAE